MQTQTHEQIEQETTASEEAETPETSEGEGTSDAAGNEPGDAGNDEEAIEIDGQKFKDEASALSYAKQKMDRLERDNLISEAYREGIADSRIATAPPQKKADEDEDPEWEEKFYANPKEAFKAEREKIRKQVLAELTETTASRDLEKKVWDDFTGLHPDLADFKTDVELMANSAEHKEVITALARTKGQQAAMDYVAQKTRAKFQAYIAASKSATVLPRGNGGVTPSGSGQSVTVKKKADEPLSMREQMRQLKNKHSKGSA